MDDSSKEFMFTKLQVSQYPASHLTGVGWYIDCAGGFVPVSEEALHRDLMATSPLELIDLEISEQPNEQQEPQRERAVKTAKGKGKKDKQGIIPPTQASQANVVTRSASNFTAQTSALPSATGVGSPSIAPTMLLPDFSQSEGTVPGVLLRKKKTILPDASVTSSESFTVSTLIENVDMAELIETFTATKVHDPRYTRIQEFLTKVCPFSRHSLVHYFCSS